MNPEAREKLAHGATWKGGQGLAEDVRYYGRWMRDEAFKRIGHFYPNAKLPDGSEATVIAWLWARTVTCPNPACGARMPLVRSFALATKKGREWHVEPVVDHEAKSVRFVVRRGKDAPDPPKEGRGANFRCLVCQQTAADDHIKAEGVSGRIDAGLMAIVAEGNRRRVYLTPTDTAAAVAVSAEPVWAPEEELPYEPRAIWCTLYGLKAHRDLFTPRQLLALTTFSDLVGEARQCLLADGADEDRADAVATYLAFGVSRLANRASSICIWNTAGEKVEQTFGRQAIPMTWDFAEANPFSDSTGSWAGSLEWIPRVLELVPTSASAIVRQLDATAAVNGVPAPLVCTDPPYYDNIGYADLADFFYVWLRRSLAGIYPRLFSTLLTPKSQELVATPYRFNGDRGEAERFFELGLRQAFAHLRDAQAPDLPLTMFYAFKQAESDKDGVVASTGWDTMLSGLLASGLAVTGTWPVRSERDQGLKTGTNVLASSIVLVCRPRTLDATLATRRELIAALKAELPVALRELQHGNIAPVDLAQAAIGPGMAIFSRYAKVVEADGSPMAVRAALGLINQALDGLLAEQEGDFDADTRFAVTWFEQRGGSEGPYGEADVLARAKNTSVRGMEEAGVLVSRGGKVRLRTRAELAADWDPAADQRLTVWEVTQHLIRRLDEGGEEAAAKLLRRVGGLGEAARELAYRLYSASERKGWAQEALAYNALVVAWPEIARLVAGTPEAEAQQALEV